MTVLNSFDLFDVQRDRAIKSVSLTCGKGAFFWGPAGVTQARSSRVSLPMYMVGSDLIERAAMALLLRVATPMEGLYPLNVIRDIEARYCVYDGLPGLASHEVLAVRGHPADVGAWVVARAGGTSSQGLFVRKRGPGVRLYNLYIPNRFEREIDP